jgi:hypothetical protein
VRRPEPGSVLDRATLNRTLLARQGLLARSRSSVPEAIERLVGMQAQVPRDPHIGLWARLEGFEPAALDAMLLQRQAVRMTLMRSTLHLVTSRDAWRLRAATQHVTERGFGSSPFRRRVGHLDLDAVRGAGTALVEARPMSTAELGRALAAQWPGEDPEAMAYAVRYLVPLVQVTPRGLFRASTAPRFTTLRSWLAAADDPAGRHDGGDNDPEQAVDEAVERYLRAFGPATTSDVRTWSGIRSVREAVDRLRPRLVAYRDEAGRELLDVAGGEFADPAQTAPVRLLGEFDNVFLGHADRTRITGELAWGAAWARRGALFVDGYLAGAWRCPIADDPTRLELEAMRPLDDRQRRDVVREAEALIGLIAGSAVTTEVAWGDR